MGLKEAEQYFEAAGLKKDFWTKSDMCRWSSRNSTAGVMVHSVGTPRDISAQTWRNKWNRPDLGKSVHAFLDEKETVQCWKWETKAGHAGGSKSCPNGTANNTHVAFEIAESKDYLTNEAKFLAKYERAAQLTAGLLAYFNIKEVNDTTVLCHSEGHKKGIASNHADVMHWFPKFCKDMNTFRQRVKEILYPPIMEDKPQEDYTIQIGASKTAITAVALRFHLYDRTGMTARLVRTGGYVKVQTGRYTKDEADKTAAELKEKGFEAWVTKHELSL